MPTKVNCRFICESVKDFGHNFKEVTLLAIWTGHPDDNSYSQATPSGKLVFSVTNPDFMDTFVPTKTYDIVITEHETHETGTTQGD